METGHLAWIPAGAFLGYGDFRSLKILQPAVSSTMGAVLTIVAADPVASAVSHVGPRMTTVVHASGTTLYPLPHRDPEDPGRDATARVDE